MEGEDKGRLNTLRFAHELGWQVAVCDPRPAFARPRHFPRGTHIARCAPADLVDEPFFARLDAAMVMSHNTDIDASALRALRAVSLGYLGLLGPHTRHAQVLEQSGCRPADFACAISGPAGLDLGGDLPADIALSIVAECHAVTYGRSAQRLASARTEKKA